MKRSRDLAQRVKCSVDTNSAFPTYFSGGVKVTLRDGRQLFRHVRVNSGAGERMLMRDGVVAKFMASASLAIGQEQAAKICEAVLDVENRSARELARSLRLP